MSDNSDLTGRRLGIFQIERMVGRGGMGVVFQAVDTNLHRPVALKVLPREFSFDESFVARFLLEARAAAQLNHANIVTIFAVGEQDGTHYIAMEFIEGVTLEQRLKESGPIAPDAALRILRQTAEALREAHSRRMIHRDIKPSNIMLDRKGVARVMDFGLVRAQGATSKLTVAGTLMGTPAYIAPEVYNSADADHRTDIYALGITFFEMLTGRPPFQSDTPAGMMYHALNTELPVDLLKKSGVPARCIRLIEAMTQKDPGLRIQSADELIQAIDTGRIPKRAMPTAQKQTPRFPARPSLPKLPALPKMPSIPAPRFDKLGKMPRKYWIFAGISVFLIVVGLRVLNRAPERVEQVVSPAPAPKPAKVLPSINLADWTTPGEAGPSPRWGLEENALVAAPEPGAPPARLQTLDWWRDYRLELEVKGSADAFGALNLRDGVRIELRAAASTEAASGTKLAKDPYGEVTAQAELAPEEWHHFMLALEGGRIRMTLNDHPLETAIQGGQGGLPAPIALEVSTGSMWFRGIEPLSFDVPAKPARRAVQFAESPSLGSVTVWVAGEYLTASIPWLGEAQGGYTISRGMEFGLMPPGATLQNLAIVDLLPDSSINGLVIAASPFAPHHLDRLKRLPSLTKLFFVKSAVGDEHLKNLPRLPNLDQLVISEEVNISNAALENLPRIPWLKVLLLDHSNVTAEKADLADKFPTLRALSLRGCRLNRRSLEQTGVMDQLHYLDVSDTAAAPEMLQALARMPALQSLDVSLCSLMDESALPFIFAPDRRIRHLNLSYTGITRAALLEHAQSETLETLSCLGLGITREDLAALRKSLPNCEIKF